MSITIEQFRIMEDTSMAMQARLEPVDVITLSDALRSQRKLSTAGSMVAVLAYFDRIEQIVQKSPPATPEEQEVIIEAFWKHIDQETRDLFREEVETYGIEAVWKQIKLGLEEYAKEIARSEEAK